MNERAKILIRQFGKKFLISTFQRELLEIFRTNHEYGNLLVFFSHSEFFIALPDLHGENSGSKFYYVYAELGEQAFLGGT